MGLTKDDLGQIRNVVLEALDVAVNPRLDKLEGRQDRFEERMDRFEERMDRFETELRSLSSQLHEINNRLSRLEESMEDVRGRLEALENDVKELYRSVTEHDHPFIGNKKYLKLPETEKILVLYEAMQVMAKKLHVTLPQPR